MSQELLAHEAGVDRSCMGGVDRGEHNLMHFSVGESRCGVQIAVECREGNCA